ncbi:unnamed protein product, partial [Mesorhabditis spiculigera]
MRTLSCLLLLAATVSAHEHERHHSKKFRSTTLLARVRRQADTNTEPGCMGLTVQNGNVNYIQGNPQKEMASGTSATATCNLGFVPSGTMTVTCQNGAWTPQIGTCNAAGAGAPGTSGVGGNVGATGVSTSPLGVPSNPAAPGAPGANAPATPGGMHASGSTATLTCNPQFVASGETTATCNNGVWNPPTVGMCNPSGSAP